MRALFLALLLAVPPAAATAQAPFPTRPPAPAPLHPVRFPPYVTARLASGADLIVVENHEQPVVTLTLAVPAGTAHDPADRVGVAELLADLITKGTATRTAEQIAEQIEGAGGGIGASAGDDYLTITVSALAENLAQALGILADVVVAPSFPASEVELTRTRVLSALQVALSQPQTVAQRNFQREVYGDHPYGRYLTPAGVRAIARDDVVRFHAERVRPGGALFVVAGDVDPVQVGRLADQAFAAWTGRAPAAGAQPVVPVRARTEIVLVHRPGSPQSNVVAGFPFVTPANPSRYALIVMNRVLGEGADSRLFMILRERMGLTYGAYSGFTSPRGVGAFSATVEARTSATDTAVTELLRQLERMRSEMVPDSELRGARSYLVGSFPRSIETPEQIAGQVATARLRGLPDDYVIRYRDRLSAVTAAQLRMAARRYLTTDRMAVVVVGDGPQLLPRLRAIAPVRIVDVEGRPLTEGDLAPRAAGAVAWAAERIAAATFTYRVLLQGNPFGQEVRRLERTTEDGRAVWRITTATSLGPIGGQDDTTTIDAATLAPLRVRQGGVLQGQPVFVRLDYAEGRVRGQAQTPQQGGPRAITVDTAVAAGTLDDNELGAVMVALPFAAGARWSLPVFAGGEAALKTYTVSVAAEESVTVPAGTFACWRVEVTGGPVPVTFFVTKDAPYSVVKLELQGTPLAFELTQRN
jgi:zinc protease